MISTPALRLSGLLAALFLLFAAPSASASFFGEKTAGIKAGYSTKTETPIAGIFFQFRPLRHFRIAPSVQYSFRHHGADALLLNVDLHFPLLPGSRFNVYPIAGVNFSSWSDHNDDRDVSNRASRIGLNAGAGLDFKPTSTLRLFAEGNYYFVKNYGSAIISVGMGYCF